MIGIAPNLTDWSLGHPPTLPQNFVMIRSYFFNTGNRQADKQTDPKNNLFLRRLTVNYWQRCNKFRLLSLSLTCDFPDTINARRFLTLIIIPHLSVTVTLLRLSVKYCSLARLACHALIVQRCCRWLLFALQPILHPMCSHLLPPTWLHRQWWTTRKDVGLPTW